MTLTLFMQLVLTGIGATLGMDVWACLLKRVAGIAALDYALPGRWLLGMRQGRFRHRRITDAPAVSGEKAVGWSLHYFTGIAFAFIPPLLSGQAWLVSPAFSTALATGLLTLAAPFLIMQPALGFGIAASKTPNPPKARLLSLLAHLAYGVGLYLSARWILG